MYLEDKKRSNIPGLILLFFVFTIVGCILSFIYVFALDLIPMVYLCVIVTVLFGSTLGFVVSSCVKRFKITTKLGAFVAVLLGLAVITFFKWNMFFVLNYSQEEFASQGYEFSIFADYKYYFSSFISFLVTPHEFINDLRYFNEVGTWSYSETDSSDAENIKGIILAVIWGVEFVLLTFFPIKACFENNGICLPGHKSWAMPRFLNYNFAPFEYHEIESIKSGEIKPILEKHKVVATASQKINKLSVFCYNGMNTEYIGIYKNAGKNLKMIDKPIRLTHDKINELEKELLRTFGLPAGISPGVGLPANAGIGAATPAPVDTRSALPPDFVAPMASEPVRSIEPMTVYDKPVEKRFSGFDKFDKVEETAEKIVDSTDNNISI